MDFFPLVLAIAGIFGWVLLHKKFIANRSNLPPEPAGAWPIIGHLHLLYGPNHLARTLGAFADKYGPVFTIRLGMKKTLVVNNWEAAKECCTTNDKVFASRPSSSLGEHLCYNYASFGVAPYGPFWREIRKLVMEEVLSPTRLELLSHVRISEIQSGIKELFTHISKDGGLKHPVKVDIGEWFEELSLNVVLRKISGRRYTGSPVAAKLDAEFKRIAREFMFVGGQPIVSDVIPLPFLEWLDPQGHIRSMKRISKELDNVVQIWIDEHNERRLNSENEQDFIDVLLSVIKTESTFGHSKEIVIKATLMSLILAGFDPVSIHLAWLLSLLLNHRHEMRRAQEEIDKIVGKERWVEDSDIKSLPYVGAIVKEAIRLYPPGPLAIPHESSEDCHVGGYLIPKGTQLFLNLWKMQRDPRIWSEPEKFLPERFLTGEGAGFEFSAQKFEFTPFGIGRRSCPGKTLAMQLTRLTVARLLQGFDITTPSNLPVDMSEGNGITMPRTNSLEVLMLPRLPNLRLYE